MAAHAHTGVLRVMIAKVSRPDDWVDRARRVLGVLRRSLEADGGSLVVSSGPPEIVCAISAWGEVGPAALLSAGIQAAFDPAGILARGASPQ